LEEVIKREDNSIEDCCDSEVCVNIWKMQQESKSIPCRAKGGNGRRK